MKKSLNSLIFLFCLTPVGVLAWSSPGQDFNGELILGGSVTNTRNPWAWKLGEGEGNLDVQTLREVREKDKRQTVTVNLPAKNILLGKTMFTMPSGREGLIPRISFGVKEDDFSLEWTGEGKALVTLPVWGDGNARAGTFSFRMIAGGVLCHITNDIYACSALYDDINSNGLPSQYYMIKPERTLNTLMSMFSAEAPAWLNKVKISTSMGVSRYGDLNIHQISGAYGAQIVAGSGILRIDDVLLSNWRVSLPVNIEYQ
ncbi:fimbrial protein [Escherichia coli]|nr:fimbrial protein [Escherichia coli]